MILANMMKEQGEYAAAVLEYQEALRLLIEENVLNNRGSEALTRWGLAKTLKQMGKVQEAKTELEQAIHIQKELVIGKAGSKEQLKQFQYEISRYE